MIREDDILLCLSQDNWFVPSKSVHKKQLFNEDGTPMLDEYGNEIIVPVSFYKSLRNGTQLVIRFSNHGTDLETWVRHNPNPTQSLQNVSIVFTHATTNPKITTIPHNYIDENGNKVNGYRYFVVEEFAYNYRNLNIKDLQKIINSIKKIESYDENSRPAFQDPLENRSDKRAGISVLTPQDEYRRNISPNNNYVHPRQRILADHPNNKIDANGNIISENTIDVTASDIKKMVMECVIRIQEALSIRKLGKFIAYNGNKKFYSPIGLEEKSGPVQNIRNYKSKKELIRLWRRSDDSKYFYAKTLDGKTWIPLTYSDVGQEIHDDFLNIWNNAK